MHFSAQFAASAAATEDERSRVHTSGPDKGTFYVSFNAEASPAKQPDGSYDFAEAYVEGMREFLIAEPRVAQGEALRVSVIS